MPMKIIKTRIRSVDNYLSNLRPNEEFYISFGDTNTQLMRLLEIGFSEQLEIGNKILPAIVGGVTKFNANGKFIVHNDRPKEPYTMERFWRRRDYQGNEIEEYIYITKTRYPRTFIPAPTIELLIAEKDGNKLILSPKFQNSTNNHDIIKHTINVFLEIFGECDIIREDLSQFIPHNIIRLNWRIFPTGERTWQEIRDNVVEQIRTVERGTNRRVILRSIDRIAAHSPDYHAIGIGGFNDYMVFGFTSKNIYILESFKNGNATYIFDENWSDYSKMTKADILTNNLQLDRIIHTPDWESRLNAILR